MAAEHERDLILRRINHWIEHVVIGLQLCPFARHVYRSGLVKITLLDTADCESCLQQVAGLAEKLNQCESQDTHLLVLTRGFEQFDDYLDLLALAEALLTDLGYEGAVQIASFHPDYCFAEAEFDEPGNWTNRSPYPILHLLSEHSVEQAVNSYPNPEAIPNKNIEKLTALGADAIRRLMQGY